MKNVSNSNIRGFTLVELLVAIVILGVAIVPMVDAYVQSWTASIEADRKTRAIMLARWKIERVRSNTSYDALSGIDRSSCSLPTGYWESDGGEYGCEVNVTTVPGSDTFEAKKIGVKVFFSSVVYKNERTITCTNSCSISQPDFITYISKYSN